MKNFKMSSNKGNATYYVMVVIMVITIMVSGLLYVSLRSSIVTTNYANDISDYNKCESALMKIKGEMSATLVGETVDLTKNQELHDWCIGYLQNKSSKAFFLEGVSGAEFYYPAPPDENCTNTGIVSICKILGCYKEEIDHNSEIKLVHEDDGHVLIKGDNLGNGRVGFEIEYVGISAANPEAYFVVKNITIQSGAVGITTDIKLCIYDGKINKVVFANYRIFNVTTEEGGDGE